MNYDRTGFLSLTGCYQRGYTTAYNYKGDQF